MKNADDQVGRQIYHLMRTSYVYSKTKERKIDRLVENLFVFQLCQNKSEKRPKILSASLNQCE